MLALHVLQGVHELVQGIQHNTSLEKLDLENKVYFRAQFNAVHSLNYNIATGLSTM